jgi:hypothetical protein
MLSARRARRRDGRTTPVDGSKQYWWCLTHGRVEQDAGCPNKERLGPYATEQQAAGVIQRTAERTAQQDARDREERAED